MNKEQEKKPTDIYKRKFLRRFIEKKTGKPVPASPKMASEVLCPCHKSKMIIKVSDGQLINLKKECKRQVRAGTREIVAILP